MPVSNNNVPAASEEPILEEVPNDVESKLQEDDLVVTALEVVDEEEITLEALALQEEATPKEEPLKQTSEVEIDLSENTEGNDPQDEFKQGGSPFHTISEQELEAAYAAMSDGEKQQLIEAFEDNTEDLASKEFALIEFIAEEETNSELGYRAFSIIRSQIQKTGIHFGKNITVNEESEELPLSNHTIFYELYQHAADLDSRLILLKEIAAIGDNKELPFLYELAADTHPRIKNSVNQAITSIKNRLNEAIPSHADGGDEEEEQQEPDETVPEIQEDHRLPLELAFLYDQVGILPEKSKKTEAIFDFDLSDAFEIKSDMEEE